MKIFKSLLYSVLIFVLIGSLGACSEECGYDSHAGYQLGKQNFDYLEGNMASILSFWDLALRMNTYLTAWMRKEKTGQKNFSRNIVFSK